MAVTLTCPVTNTATIGDAYASALTPAGGVAPYSFAVTGGALPPGLHLDPVSGEVLGVPMLLGAFPYSVTVTDSTSATGVADCTLTVGLPSPNVNVVFTGFLRYLVEDKTA